MKKEYIKGRPGVVRLIPKMDNLLIPDRYIEEAIKLLGNKENEENLKDSTSVDLADSMLLVQEEIIHTVIFSIRGKDIEVNKNNIKEIRNRFLARKEGPKVRGNREAIKDAIAELEEKY